MLHWLFLLLLFCYCWGSFLTSFFDVKDGSLPTTIFSLPLSVLDILSLQTKPKPKGTLPPPPPPAAVPPNIWQAGQPFKELINGQYKLVFTNRRLRIVSLTGNKEIWSSPTDSNSIPRLTDNGILQLDNFASPAPATASAGPFVLDLNASGVITIFNKSLVSVWRQGGEVLSIVTPPPPPKVSSLKKHVKQPPNCIFNDGFFLKKK